MSDYLEIQNNEVEIVIEKDKLIGVLRENFSVQIITKSNAIFLDFESKNNAELIYEKLKRFVLEAKEPELIEADTND